MRMPLLSVEHEIKRDQVAKESKIHRGYNNLACDRSDFGGV
jgi:hypothetical protein